jgi:hypothetical protein
MCTWLNQNGLELPIFFVVVPTPCALTYVHLAQPERPGIAYFLCCCSYTLRVHFEELD